MLPASLCTHLFIFCCAYVCVQAKLQSTSPNGPRVTPNSRQNSPLSAVVVAAVAAGADDFSRKPTRASAPSAPHSLNKKIAALDLLSTGIAEATVAAQHGITTNLLEQWKTNEASLRNVSAPIHHMIRFLFRANSQEFGLFSPNNAALSRSLVIFCFCISSPTSIPLYHLSQVRSFRWLLLET